MVRKKRARNAVALLLALVLVVGGIFGVVTFLQRSETLVTENCVAVVDKATFELAPDQAANAALISAIAVRRGLPARAASIALATAIQESKLRNITYGDRDSLGLFQQRPSQGWGTAEQIKDPVYATNAFYDVLVKIQGYHDLPITDAAQQVQRSGYPQAYADHEPEGRAFASALTGQSPAGMSCTLRKPDGPGNTETVNAQLSSVFGPLPTAADTEKLTVTTSGTLGWAVAEWAVANAKAQDIVSVVYGGQTWTRAGNAGWQQSAAPSDRVVITVAR